MSPALGRYACVVSVTELVASMKGRFFGCYQTQQPRCGPELRKPPGNPPEQEEDFSVLDVLVLLLSRALAEGGH